MEDRVQEEEEEEEGLGACSHCRCRSLDVAYEIKTIERDGMGWDQ